MTAVVTYTTDEKVGIITMNRPDKLNAINQALREALVATFRQADEDKATSVVILRGEGRSFCAGYDVSGENPDEPESWRHDPLKWRDHLHECLTFELGPWDMRKPVIASVQGHALGGGCELAMLCDMTIAADNALFGEPEVRFTGVGPAIVMPWIIGFKKARELLYMGDMIDAAEALRLGMVNRVVPLAELPAATLKFAKRMSAISPEALYTTKTSINRGADAAGFRAALAAGVDIVSPLYAVKTEVGKAFDAVRRRDGLAAALKWRSAQLKE